MAFAANLSRSALAVLNIFVRLQKRAGDQLSYEEIFQNLGDAKIARYGQKELAQKGLTIALVHHVELTEAGAALMDKLGS